MKTLEEKLARLRNHHTRYELAMWCGDRKILIAYTPRRGWAGITAAIQSKADAIVAAAGADYIRFGKRASDGATLGDWTINFTGRTQREAYIQGELEYVGSPVEVHSPTVAPLT